MIRISNGNEVDPERKEPRDAGRCPSGRTADRDHTGSAVAKRLTSIARARSFVNWQNRKPLVTDLESQLRAIKEQIAPADPTEALALAWRFMQVATPLFERCDDSSGIVIGVFHDACALLGAIALAPHLRLRRAMHDRLGKAAARLLLRHARTTALRNAALHPST